MLTKNVRSLHGKSRRALFTESGLKERLEVKIPELQNQWKLAKALSDKVIHKVTVDQAYG